MSVTPRATTRPPREVAAAIRSALTGDLPAPIAIEVPCHSPSTARWFDMLIAARRGDNGRPLGATVTLSLARSEDRVTPIRPERSGAAKTARAGPGATFYLVTVDRPPPISPTSPVRRRSRRAIARNCSNGSRTACTRSGSPCRTPPTSARDGAGSHNRSPPGPGYHDSRDPRCRVHRLDQVVPAARAHLAGISYHHPRLPGKDLGPSPAARRVPWNRNGPTGKALSCHDRRPDRGTPGPLPAVPTQVEDG